MKKSTPVIFTNKANCRDCYKCLRSCPVKAIKMENGQASVITDKCIYCGTCIKVCPQKAKEYRVDFYKAKEIIKHNPYVIASLAPSFKSLFSKWQLTRLPSALRKLGFAYVAETSVAAQDVAEISAAYFFNKKEKAISGACPVIVNYLEKYRPDLIGNLIPVVSPLIAHGKLLKKEMGSDVKIIFIGPCIAKKSEIEREEFSGIIDLCITFEELNQWLNQEQINLEELEESNFDQSASGMEQAFPISCGMLQTAGLNSDSIESKNISTTGFEELNELTEDFQNVSENSFIEPLFCKNGCINGPGINSDLSTYQRKSTLISNISSSINQNNSKHQLQNFDFYKTNYYPVNENIQNFSEEEINAILKKTGKSKPEEQLNCSACGYNTCRDKAIAVLSGQAELEMCLPYMRKLAERRTDKIIETSPNGIIILDHNLNILSMNNAFKKYFMAGSSAMGKNISKIIDPEPFEYLLTEKDDFIQKTIQYSQYNITCHQMMYKLKEENQFVGIFVNITDTYKNKKQLENIKKSTVLQARELMEHQIEMAQKLAEFLGDSTAKSEAILKNLLDDINAK